MVRRFELVAIALVFLALSARSEWVSLKSSASQPAAPTVTLIQDDLSGTVLRIDISGFEVKDVVAGGQTFKSIDLLTRASTAESGYPELPYVAKVLAVPDRVAISVEVLERGEEFVFQDYLVAPARPSWVEREPEPQYTVNAAAYGSNAPYPQESAIAGTPAIFRDFRITRLAAYPVKYNAAKKELRVASSLTIRLKYGDGDVINPKTSPPKPIAPSYEALYRAIIVNYQNALQRQFNGLGKGRDVLLCVVPDAYYNSILPWAIWRNKTGTQVIVTKFSEIGANATNPDIIKNYIAQVYHNWQYPPTYILLGGGYGYVPIKQITYDYTIVSEDYYVEIDGNDFIPEIMIGRFTHKSEGIEQVIVNKIVGYERTPYTASTAWFQRGVVAANDDYLSAITTKRFARDRMMQDGKFTQVDSFFNHSPCYSSLTDLINTINSGRSFLNYRGEAWYTGWSASCYNFQTSNVSSLNNGRMLTFVTNIGCGAGAFNQNSCFGSAWLELGTVAAPRGGVAFVGPTSNTHTAYNNEIDMGIYLGLFQEGMETPGQALMRGRMQMYETFGNQRWVEYQTRVYCILGDPSLRVWKDVPRSVAVTHPSNVSVGYNQISVTVLDSASGTPIKGAQVCLAGRTVYETGNTDHTGRVVIDITPEAVDTLSILVRGGKVIPYERAIRVSPATDHVGILGAPVTGDLDGNADGKINPNEHGQIRFTLKNWGTQSSSNVQAALLVDTNMVALQTTTPVSYGTLAPGDSATGSPFLFFVKPTCSVGDTIEFGLHVVSSTQTWDYTYLVDIKGCKMRCVNYVVDDRASARPNARLDPNETVKLHLAVKNVGEDIGPNVWGVLRCANPHVFIQDSVGFFGTLRMDSTAINFADYFVVRVDSTVPAQTRMPFSLLLYTQNGLYTYSFVDTLAVGISKTHRGDPTGPDTYGYYAYSSDDTLYQQAPRFSWFEIKSIGTALSGTGGNYTSTVTLPFTFRYYGTNYTQLRISTDGWIAPGSGTQTATTNYCLPRNDAVSPMIAAFWDDLIYTSSLDSQKVYYYNDNLMHRFIIEWYYVGHTASTLKGWNKETFQIILNDPRNPSVDAEILIQYKIAAYPVECTVGIENPAQTDALQYVCMGFPIDESTSPLVNGRAILFTTQQPQLLVGVSEPPEVGAVPRAFVLEQNYPNPFNPSTRIRFSVPGGVSDRTVLQVFDVLGRQVATLVDEVRAPGTHEVTWDASERASGVYFYKLTAGTFTETKKLLLIR